MQYLLGAWSVLRGLWILPLALWMSITQGGLVRWAGDTFKGAQYLDTGAITAYTKDLAGDKIHFLRTGSSDAILLESNGHFALVDAAEDSDNQKNDPDLDFPGWEAYVLDYVKRAAGDAQGKVVLDFVMGTHAHSDHIGGFDTLINDPDVTIQKAFLKPYDDSRMLSYEQGWDNQEVYDQMRSALQNRNVPIETAPSEEAFTLGNFKLTIYNGAYSNKSGDENESSMALLVESGGKRALLAADINNIAGGEDCLSKAVGKVDLLKAPHHGYVASSTLAFVTRLNPDAVVFTNEAESVSGFVLSTYAVAANPAHMLATGTYGGVVALFGTEGLSYYAIDEFADPIPVG